MGLKKRYIKPFFEFSLIEEDDLMLYVSNQHDLDGKTTGDAEAWNKDGNDWGDAKQANPFDFEAQGGYYIEDNDF